MRVALVVPVRRATRATTGWVSSDEANGTLTRDDKDSPPGPLALGFLAVHVGVVDESVADRPLRRPPVV